MRTWTEAELHKSHPAVLDGGWSWRIDAYGKPYALGPNGQTVEVDHGGLLSITPPNGDRFDPPPAIAIAVSFASKGMDSLETFTAELIKRSREECQRCIEGEAGDDFWHYTNGVERGLTEALIMLQRGRVKP